MAAIVGNGNTPTLDAVKPTDTLSLWIGFLLLGNTTLATHLGGECFSVWFAITGVIYHVNRVSIRTEECGHSAVQRNPGNYQQRLEAGTCTCHPVAGHRGR